MSSGYVLHKDGLYTCELRQKRKNKFFPQQQKIYHLTWNIRPHEVQWTTSAWNKQCFYIEIFNCALNARVSSWHCSRHIVISLAPTHHHIQVILFLFIKNFLSDLRSRFSVQWEKIQTSVLQWLTNRLLDSVFMFVS